MKNFDMHGWDYARAREGMKEIVRQLVLGSSSGREDVDAVDVAAGWLRDGGKAFGLGLCRKMARNSYRFIVPPWFAFNARNQESDPAAWGYENPYAIVRSSDMDEDWIDGRSGVHESKVCWSDRLPDILRECLALKQSVVVQAYCRGIGFVVDVGWSELLQKPIVRIAHGNISKTGHGEEYTSATWDHEAHVAIYDTAGAPIVPYQHSELVQQAPWLARSLVAGLERLNINFGVQLELICPPPSFAGWYLVQIRPSPNAVRGMQTAPAVRGELIAVTGKVSRAGIAEGEVVAVDRHCSVRRANADLRGSIALWSYDALDKYGCLDQLLEANAQGIIAHIGGHKMIQNSAHGIFSDRRFGGDAQSKLKQILAGGVIFGLDPYLAYNLYSQARKSKMQVLLVSDGLVGQVYRV